MFPEQRRKRFPVALQVQLKRDRKQGESQEREPELR